MQEGASEVLVDKPHSVVKSVFALLDVRVETGNLDSRARNTVDPAETRHDVPRISVD